MTTKKTDALLEALECLTKPYSQRNCLGEACRYYKPDCVPNVLTEAKQYIRDKMREDNTRVYEPNELAPDMQVYIEWRGDGGITPATVVAIKDGYAVLGKGRARLTKEFTDYGAEWRIWTDEPTAAQREETLWAAKTSKSA